MGIFRKCAFAAVLLAAPAAASAASLSSLTAGGGLTVGDVTFSGFGFSDLGGGFGGVAADAGAIDVTASSTATTVTLDYMLDPELMLGGFDFYEFESGFSAAVDAGSSRRFTSLRIVLADARRVGDAFIEIGSDSPNMLASLSTAGGPIDGIAALASLSSVDFDFFSQGESFESDSMASLGRFQITFGLNEAITPIGATVPLPATLPLLLGGIGLFGFVSRRKRAA